MSKFYLKAILSLVTCVTIASASALQKTKDNYLVGACPAGWTPLIYGETDWECSNFKYKGKCEKSSTFSGTNDENGNTLADLDNWASQCIDEGATWASVTGVTPTQQ